MRINFFEEYPTEENIAKLDFVDWPATVFVAAHSLREFEIIRGKYKNAYEHITFGWWPIIPGSYWVSGFAHPADLDRLFTELTFKKQEKELLLLIDLEFPIMRPSYLLKNILYFSSSKKKIKEFLKRVPYYNLKTYIAEYPVTSKVFLQFLQWGSISIPFSFPHIKLPMCYSSMIKRYFGDWIWERIKKFEKGFVQSNSGCVGFGLGTIAVGSLGNEAILSPKQLARDIAWAKECGVEEVFIFRLGGMNESYASVLKNLQ